MKYKRNGLYKRERSEAWDDIAFLLKGRKIWLDADSSEDLAHLADATNLLAGRHMRQDHYAYLMIIDAWFGFSC